MTSHAVVYICVCVCVCIYIYIYIYIYTQTHPQSNIFVRDSTFNIARDTLLRKGFFKKLRFDKVTERDYQDSLPISEKGHCSFHYDMIVTVEEKSDKEWNKSFFTTSKKKLQLYFVIS